MLAAHPTQNLFAAGHDSGLVVFKMEVERPAFTVYEDRVLYVGSDSFIRVYDVKTGSDST